MLCINITVVLCSLAEASVVADGCVVGQREREREREINLNDKDTLSGS